MAEQGDGRWQRNCQAEEIMHSRGFPQYVDIISALASLVKMKELSGTRSLKQLPQEEREQAGLQRQKQLEELLEKLKNLQSCLEKKEEMMKLHESERYQRPGGCRWPRVRVRQGPGLQSDGKLGGRRGAASR
ncbi:hypothetical protein FK515_28435, partial [Klebsiella pneumoniae]|nr:hypothetical protein [Klebsiella pneumoniae]